eukprot:gene10773-2859_t
MNVAIENLKTPLAITKTALIFFTLCAFAAVAAWSCDIPGINVTFTNIGDGRFFMAVHIIGWIASIFFTVAYMFFLGNIIQALPFNYYFLDASFCASWGFMSLLASALNASSWRDSRNTSTFRNSCGGYAGYDFGLAMGFFATFTWIASAVFAVIAGRSTQATSTAAATHHQTEQVQQNADGSVTQTTVVHNTSQYPF